MYMKATRLFLMVLSAAMLSGCGAKGDKNQQETDNPNEQYEPKVRQMPDYHVTDTATAGGHIYTYDITRQCSEQLPKVKDNDDLFADNTIHLVIHCDGDLLFDKIFTKEVFAESMEPDFLQNSILDGIRFVKAEPGQGLTFSFTVSYPDSDMSVPFLVTVDAGGNFSFVKDNNLEMEE